MEEEKIPIVPEGHKLVLRRKTACLLCQRPEFRGDWDEVIWSRKYDDFKLHSMIHEEFGIMIDPKEIKFHAKHLELIPDNNKQLTEHKKDLLEGIVEQEKDMLEINNIRNKININFEEDLEGKIKSLSAEITEMKLQGYENDPRYMAKIKEYKSLCELRYKQKGDIKEDKVCLISLEVDKIFEEYIKQKELVENGKKKNNK